MINLQGELVPFGSGYINFYCPGRGTNFEYSGSMGLEVKVKLSLYRPGRPLGLREVEAPKFTDIRLIDGVKVVSPMQRPLFTPRKIPGTHFCQRLSRSQGNSAAGGLGKLKNSTSSGTRTGNLPACSIVPQPATWSVQKETELSF
jgi:hypothetical protein